MYRDTLDYLAAMMPVPARPTRPTTASDWPPVEKEFGLRLPADYKGFLARYGSGEIDEFLLVASPVFGNRLTRLSDFARSRLEIRRAIRDADWPIPPWPIHPEAGGLLPWGTSRNGDGCFWLTDPPDEPDRWPVVVVESKSQEWLDHEGSMTDLLSGLLDRTVNIPFFPADCFFGAPRFTPLDAVRDSMDPF